MAETSAFWARHIGNGDHQIPAETMTRLVKLQAEVSQLHNEKESLPRLKALYNAQTQWRSLINSSRIPVINISVGGCVRNPGQITAAPGTDLAEAIHLAGGATAFGSTRRVELHRQGKKFIYDLRKDHHGKIKLNHNDTINVPQKVWMGNGGGAPNEAVPFESAAQKNWITGTIKQQTWSSDLPYIRVLSYLLESDHEWLPTYQAFSTVYGWRADFYLDVVNLLESHSMKTEALAVATNIAQLEVNSPELLRRSARLLNRLGDSETAKAIFERVTYLADDEPTSFIDLARWYRDQDDLEKSISYYARVTENSWPQHWHATWINAMIEMNGLLNKYGKKLAQGTVSSSRQTPISADLRVVVDWDAARSNVNLEVREPFGQSVSSGSHRSEVGGWLPSDAFAGYGPEQYLIQHAIPGTYDIRGKFRGDWNHDTKSSVTIDLRVIMNFGRKNETTQLKSFRIPESKLLELSKIHWDLNPNAK